ncbi:MAG: universal stress protein [Haloarculaceae archaeon]
MDRALVVHDDSEAGLDLLEEAIELAAGVDAELRVLALMTQDEYAEREEAVNAMAREENTSYDDSVVLDYARKEARDDVNATLDAMDVDVEWNVIAGRIGSNENAGDRILTAAEDNDVDHVFMTGRRRSPTGKVVFGDRAQTVILNFPGPVTTLLGR